MAWNASNNRVFFERLGNLAAQYRSTLDEGQRLRDLWFGEGVSGDAAFADVNGVTTAEATDMITLLLAFDDFMRNAPVTQADRVPTLTAHLAARP